MEKVIGPTISVSVDGFYITGYSTDTLSGTAGYCYNTSDEPGEYTDADGSTTEYTAEQYHIQATGTYRFHAIDVAGNHNFDTTEEITFYTYHCNYCGQDTNDLTNHYRCPTHFTSSECQVYGTCTITSKCSGYLDTSTIYGTYGAISQANGSVYCSKCKSIKTGNYYYNNNPMSCPVCYGQYTLNWCTSHGYKISVACTKSLACGKMYIQNYSTY